MAYNIVGSSEPVAVVGTSCRLAGGSTSPSKLWDLLCKPVDLSREVPREKFNAEGFYHEDAEYHGTTNCIKAYWLDEDCRRFDSGFFNITPKEAEAMDPQQRLLLEVVFEAMESAGFPLSQYNGKSVGVFAGCMTQDYESHSGRDELVASQYFSTGNSRAILSNRISYFFNFRGPSMTIDTACSSSLVALNEAVLNLRAGNCTMACVTGANLMFTPDQFIVESNLHMLSPTGKCHMWDTRADGYARGEGFAALLIKPLSRALADGDKIEGIIRAVGANVDGRTSGITIPNPEAQAALIRSTYRKAGLDPTNPAHRCQYFEAHGTGTAAGDPREAAAIHEAFFGGLVSGEGDDHDKLPDSDKKMLVGSVKTVIGHTEAAAGLAGVLKALWSMKHGLVPANLHFENLNPAVKPFYTHLEIPTTLMPWPDAPPGEPRRASVNSFGFGGANAHVILEAYTPAVHDAGSPKVPTRSGSALWSESAVDIIEQATGVLAPQPQPSATNAPNAPNAPAFRLPIVISAASHKSLRDFVQSHRTYLDENDVDILQLAWHQYAHRTDLPYHVAFSAATKAEALAALDSLLLNQSTIPLDRVIRSKTSESPLRILGIFTGQGAAWATMSMTLLQQNSVYRKTIRKLDRVLQACPEPCSWTLEEQILAGKDLSLVHQSAVSQPICTALQIALVDFLRSIGIGFHTVVGHSSGEIAAAYAAGRVSAEDAIMISYYRGMVAHTAHGPEGQKGGMLVARMSEEEALILCSSPPFRGHLNIAATNSPRSITLSGDVDSIQLAHEQLKDEKKASRILQIDTAYHSYHMNGPAASYATLMQTYGIKPNSEGDGTTWISSVQGRPRTEQEGLDCKYWEDNMVNQVEFTEAVGYALSQSSEDFDCAIEVGPHPALQSPVSETSQPLGRKIPYACPLNRTKDAGVSVSNFLEFILSHFGPSKVDLRNYIEHSPKRGLTYSRLSNAPQYPFDHSVGHWRDSRISRNYHFRTHAPHELLGVRSREDNSYEMKWRNILKIEKLPWLGHHQFQGQALLPASAYCVMALDAARQYLAGQPASLIELRDIEIYSGIAIDRDSVGVETLFSLSVSMDDKDASTINGTFALYSCPADGTTQMKKRASGALHIVLGERSWGILPPRQAPLSETSTTDPEVFYEMMNETGLLYTGPFRALTTIQRRYRYCCASLARFHPDETTKLGVSPATLDACFQSAFLTYTSPGDGSLWTSFLPTGIRRIRFNLAALEGSTKADHNGTLTVDSHLVRCVGPVEASRASIAIDGAIFNETGQAEIQIEDLVVRAFANTKPEKDLELYLHTVVDVDPTDEIVQADDAAPNDDGVLLAENCRRLSSCFRNEGSLTETPETINTMISNSQHADYLAAVWLAGRRDPALSRALPFIMKEARQVSVYRNHIGRIVKQIVHRYPWMNILYMPTAQLNLTRLILDAIGGSFRSFNVGTSRGTPSPRSQELVPHFTEGVQELDIDLLGELKDLKDQIGPDTLLDLVILPTTLLGDKDTTTALEKISHIMKDGGFLILINPHTAITDGQLKSFSDDSPSHPPTHSPWLKVLDTYGFTRQARHSNISHHAGLVLVRQFCERKSFTIPPSIKGSSTIIDSLLLVRSTSGEGNDQLVAGLQNQISPYCREAITRSLDDATAQELEHCTAVIMLADLDEPVMPNMTQHRISQLLTLLRPTLTILWVTCDARSGNPEHAASFGFLRTIAAEVPTLKLQVLDLDPNDAASPTDRISSAFYQLISTDKEPNNKSLWALEPEIHMENGRRLIPRVMPWKDGNDRVNALHRIVTMPVNAIRQCIELVLEALSDGTARLKLNTGPHPSERLERGKIVIQVDYSSALPLDLFGYACVGREVATNKRILALSNTNSSYLTCTPSQTVTLECDKHQGLVVLHKFVRHVAATHFLSIGTKGTPLVLVDPDVEFAKQLTHLAAARRKVVIVGTCCNEEDNARYTEMTECEVLRGHVSGCLHPRSLLADLRRAFPQRSAILNFLPESHELSGRIKASVPSGCTIYAGVTELVSNMHMWGDKIMWLRLVTETINTLFKAVMQSLPQGMTRTIQQFKTISTVSASELLSRPENIQPFEIVDWNRDGNALQVIGHTIDGPLVFPDKTYYMFGMTRDFGHSLCRFFLERGARHIVLASRNPDTSPHWVAELNSDYAADIRIERADVTSLPSLLALKAKTAKTMPPVGGVVNGAMVLDDRLFSQMTVETWDRVMRPKTVGSANLDMVFSDPGLDFFIMTSSFAAIGGHMGQSNYAAANMYMNGLAANRRKRGLPGTALNIGVIYGLGFLQREKTHLYAGLEREGYPPISEHQLHHMFLEAIVAGRPTNDPGKARNPFDITTGLRRFRRGSPNPLHWHEDLRFGHFAMRSEKDDGAAEMQKGKTKKSLVEELVGLWQKQDVAEVVARALEERLRALMQFPDDAAIDMHSSLMDLGVDSLTAVEVRNWFNKTLGKDFAVMKIINAPSILQLCMDAAAHVLANHAGEEREVAAH
ncbi:hypothetical protein F5Y01DRAFT_318086 [Xylaria sp. FL0043]|nr:hypothetical protein F5Y01DRAFT_318086 [Xylaria sp. FL0043]